MFTRLLSLLSGVCLGLCLQAQYTPDKVMGLQNQELADSLKKIDYQYLLPIWGKKVVEKGFNLPKSAGFSAQYIYQQSDIIIENLQVGFNNGPKVPLDEIIRFNSATATAEGVNIRPDIWLFPFLNVYAILAKAETSTAIDAGIWLPDSSGWKEIANIKTKASFDATTFGFGFTPTVGIRGFFLAFDLNFTWTDIQELDEPAFVSVFGARFGKNITLKRPDQSIALWAGGFRVKLSSETNGYVNASDIFPTNEWGQRIDNGYNKVAEYQTKVDDWWNGLTPIEQRNPVNKAKHEAANKALSTFGRVLDGASQIVTGASNSTIQYSLTKRAKDMWNFIVGSQYQLNRSWMIRAEYGFLGSRQQFIAGIQYRFNL